MSPTRKFAIASDVVDSQTLALRLSDKDIAERLTKRLYTVLTADELDEEMIVRRMKSLLDAENELKLYQVHVRISLLSQISAEQRKAARELAKQKPEADWRGVMAKKVERVRQLSKQLQDRVEPITDIEKRMKEINEMVAAGKATEGSRMLDQVIRDLKEPIVK